MELSNLVIDLVIDLDSVIWKNFIAKNDSNLFNDRFLVKRRALLRIIEILRQKEYLSNILLF